MVIVVVVMVFVLTVVVMLVVWKVVVVIVNNVDYYCSDCNDDWNENHNFGGIVRAGQGCINLFWSPIEHFWASLFAIV